MAFTGKRINVIGTSGSGKTTFARRTAEVLGFPHFEMDALFWRPNWGETPVDEFRQKVREALKGDTWTIDGNYSKVRDIVWARADTVVWLDYPFAIVMGRVIWRTFRRGLTREELWSGNRERLWGNLFSKDSIIRWSMNTYWRRKREYPVMFEMPEHAHINFIRLRSLKEGEAWLAWLAEESGTQ
jgi:adenylate kinase family enzyme